MKKIKSINLKKSVFIFLALSLLNVSCEDSSSGQYNYKPPENTEDGLEVGSLDEVNIEPGLIVKAINKIYDNKFKEVHSVLIFRNNKLVLEEYFPGHDYKWDAPYHHGEWVTWDRDMVHDIMSASKSIVSACIGIAADHGFIESLHQSIFDYLPEHQHLKIDGKDRITIEHLLTMTSGLEWREWSAPYSSVENPCIGIWFQDKDPITYILEKPLVNEPGTNFNYATGNMDVLGEILINSSGMNISEFSKKYLFEPLGVDTASWYMRFKNGTYDVNSLKITPRAMLKFGVTFLNKGKWNGKQIISEQWVEKCVVPYNGNRGINVPGERSGKLGYSYTWWTKEYYHSGRKIHMFTASGFGGQHIMVLPELNTVVVFTGGNYLSKRPPFKILEKYIMPAIN
jgi:CubicO group peptidase (beta-lactamase class C family)